MIDLDYYVQKFREEKMEEVCIYIDFHNHWGEERVASLRFEEEGLVFLKIEVREPEARESIAKYLEPIFGKLAPYDSLLIEYYNFEGDNAETLQVLGSSTPSFRLRKVFSEKGSAAITKGHFLNEGYFNTPVSGSPYEPEKIYLLKSDGEGGVEAFEVKTAKQWGLVGGCGD